jgi:hypothetical protein
MYLAMAWTVFQKIPDDVVGFFNLPNTSSPSMALGVDSASDRNEYQEYSWG